MRPPAGTVRGPLDGGVPGGGTGVPGAVGGRLAGGRLVIALPGRDDTTRGAGDTGADDGVGDGVDDGVDDGAVSVDNVAGDVGAAGGVTTLVTTDAGGNGETGAAGAATSATGAVDTEGAATVLLAVGASGAASASDAEALVDFFARVVFGFASSSPVAAFLARFGLSTIGSPFKPFSSA